MFLDSFDRPGVYLTAVWEDEDLFELEIQASSGRFTGKARCYTTREQVAQLARSIDRFPKSTADRFCFSTHAGDNVSYFSLDFRCVNGRGHVVVRVKVAEIVHLSNAPGTDDVVEFDLGVAPASIDICHALAHQFWSPPAPKASTPLGPRHSASLIQQSYANRVFAKRQCAL